MVKDLETIKMNFNNNLSGTDRLTNVLTKDLSCFKVLHLQSGQKVMEIHCEMRELENTGPSKARSYVWST